MRIVSKVHDRPWMFSDNLLFQYDISVISCKQFSYLVTPEEFFDSQTSWNLSVKVFNFLVEIVHPGPATQVTW